MVKEMVTTTSTSTAVTKNLQLAIQSEILRRKMLLVAKPRKGGQIRFTGKQVELLETLFHQSKYISSDERKDISIQAKLTEKQIKTWFQNRRAKLKKNLHLPRNNSLNSSINLNQINSSSPICSSSSSSSPSSYPNNNIYEMSYDEMSKKLSPNINICKSICVTDDISSSDSSQLNSPCTSTDEF